MHFTQWFDEAGLSDLDAPVVVLKNGIRIANFSSPHQFIFDDGTVLPQCYPSRSNGLMLNSIEVATPNQSWIDITLRFELSNAVSAAINELELREDIDIILVPFPVLEALKAAGQAIGKCRVCRVADRVTKVLHSDKFCC